MRQQAERSAEELRRLIIERRREMLATNAEFNRLQAARASAPAEQHERLLEDIDRVAARHRAVTTALDALTDALIRLNRQACARATRRHIWLRPWRALAH